MKEGTALWHTVLAMHVAAMSARAWLEIGEFDLASRMADLQLGIDNSNARDGLLHTWLGDRPNYRAYFFHESVGDENFERYLSRLNDGFARKNTSLRELVRENYVDFWNDDALSSIQNPPPFGRREAVR